jgi:ParB/RepB/Spo0J family partition protein
MVDLKSLNDSLKIDELVTTAPTDAIQFIDLELLHPNPYQPRFVEEVEELKESIKESGLLTPIAVTMIKGKYYIIGGHRRYKACVELNYKAIKCCFIADVDDKSLQSLAIVENLQRQDLHPLELALAIDGALNNGFTRWELCSALAKSPSYISKCTSILKLHPSILDDLQKSKSKIGLEILVDLQRLGDDDIQLKFYLDYKNGTITQADIRTEINRLKNRPAPSIFKSSTKKLKFDYDWSGFDEDIKSKFKSELETFLQSLEVKYKNEK